MRQRLRSSLTYANVMATLAVFIALGGSATAAVIITSNSQVAQGTISGHKPPAGKHANIITGSVNGTDVANNSLGGAKINESALGKVPSAASADSVSGKNAAELEGARAYAVVRASFCAAPVSFCTLQRNKGVAYAAHVATGKFCVGVNGIAANDPTTLAEVTPAVGGADTWARWRGASLGNVDCVGSEFEVQTGVGAQNADRDFTIVIP
jgi:hypothetical protein